MALHTRGNQPSRQRDLMTVDDAYSIPTTNEDVVEVGEEFTPPSHTTRVGSLSDGYFMRCTDESFKGGERDESYHSLVLLRDHYPEQVPDEPVIPDSDVVFGLLYNWYAATDVRGIAASGWHVPTNAEWATLIAYLGGGTDAASALKEAGIDYWQVGNDGTNISNFNARGSAMRDSDGTFYDIKDYIELWSNNEGYDFGIQSSTAPTWNLSGNDLKSGFAIRLIKDSTTLTHGQEGIYTGNDGKIYRSISINGQEWLADNLCETKYRPGTTITSGALYNWYAISDVRGIASSGWRVPSTSDFQTLMEYYDPAGLYDNNTAGGYLKETGTVYWDSPNTDAVNDSLFNGRGAGSREILGAFADVKIAGRFWNTGGYSANGYFSELVNNSGIFYTSKSPSSFAKFKYFGLSARLVKISTTLTHGQSGTYTGNDGRLYRTICIGTQEWLADNLVETKYSNGDSITEVTDSSTWVSLTAGAMCYYDNDIANAIQSASDDIPEVTDNATWAALTTGALCAYDNDWSNAYTT